MKNYELIELLLQCPAGAEVKFWGCVGKEGVEETESGFYTVCADRRDVDVDKNTVNLYC